MYAGPMNQKAVSTERAPPRPKASEQDRLADLEAWAMRIGWHVSALYFVVIALGFGLLWNVMGWGDALITGR